MSVECVINMSFFITYLHILLLKSLNAIYVLWKMYYNKRLYFH